MADTLETKIDKDQLSGVQDTLVSGTNIKTINNQSLLGSGNIEIQSGGNNIIRVSVTVNDVTELPPAEMYVDEYALVTEGQEQGVYLSVQNEGWVLQTIDDNTQILDEKTGYLYIYYHVGVSLNIVQVSAKNMYVVEQSPIGTIDEVFLEDRNWFSYRDTLMTDITVDSNLESYSQAMLSFKTGDSINFTSNITGCTYLGTDCSNGTFTPLPNKTYDIMFYMNYDTINAMVIGV